MYTVHKLPVDDNMITGAQNVTIAWNLPGASVHLPMESSAGHAQQ